MSDDKKIDKNDDPYDGSLPDDADLGPSDDDTVADDIAAAIPSDNSAAKADGSGPLP